MTGGTCKLHAVHSACSNALANDASSSKGFRRIARTNLLQRMSFTGPPPSTSRPPTPPEAPRNYGRSTRIPFIIFALGTLTRGLVGWLAISRERIGFETLQRSPQLGFGHHTINHRLQRPRLHFPYRAQRPPRQKPAPEVTILGEPPPPPCQSQRPRQLPLPLR